MRNFIDRSSTKKTFNDLKFSDAEETIIKFMVIPNLSSVRVVVTCEKDNAAFERTDKLSSEKNFNVADHADTYEGYTLMHEIYLRKINHNYFAYCLGKNGEPIQNKKLNVSIKFKDPSHEQDEE